MLLWHIKRISRLCRIWFDAISSEILHRVIEWSYSIWISKYLIVYDPLDSQRKCSKYPQIQIYFIEMIDAQQKYLYFSDYSWSLINCLWMMKLFFLLWIKIYTCYSLRLGHLYCPWSVVKLLDRRKTEKYEIDNGAQGHAMVNKIHSTLFLHFIKICIIFSERKNTVKRIQSTIF